MTVAAAAVPKASKPKEIKPKDKRLTYRDYARLTPPDSGNYELHDGQIIHMPSPTPRHQRIALWLTRKMADFAETNNIGEVFIAPLDTLLDRFNTFQPDVLFISKERLGIIGKKKIEAAPDLVVEVLSGGNSRKEMLHKRHTYEVFGVKEYWLINPEKETVTLYVLEDGEFEQHKFSFDHEIASAVMPGFKACLRSVVS
ncbi:MAG: Uma2 family endonuclease [Saprospiraceae bacterium]|nr:Uma2 family endonuclease [Saprospiraceae bacterium]